MEQNTITIQMFTERGWTEAQAQKLVDIFRRHEMIMSRRTSLLSRKKWDDSSRAIYPPHYADLAEEIANANLYDSSL